MQSEASHIFSRTQHQRTYIALWTPVQTALATQPYTQWPIVTSPVYEVFFPRPRLSHLYSFTSYPCEDVGICYRVSYQSL
jgi:hypothetical protein